MTLSELLVVGLAAHRLWAIWHWGEIARPTREWLARRQGRIGSWVSYLAQCQLCTSVYCGAMATAVWLTGWWGQVADYALAAGVLVFASEGVLTLVNSAAARNRGQAMQAAVNHERVTS